MFSFVVLRVLFCALIGHFCVDFMIGIWPVFKTMAHLDLMLAGFIAGGCALFGEGLQFFFGSLADRGYARWLVGFGILLATLSTLFPFVHSYWAFFFLYLGTCIGSSAFHPTACSLLGGLKLTNKNSVMALFSAFGGLGIGISQLTFTWTYATFDGATYLISIPFVLLALLALFGLPKQTVQPNRASFSPKVFLSFMKDRYLRVLWITMMGNQIAAWSFIFLLPDFLQSRGFDTWIVFGGGHVLYCLGGATLTPLLGYLADRNSAAKMITSLSFIASICYYSFLFLPITSQPILLGLLYCLGGLIASISPLAWSLGNQLRPDNRGMVSAFLMGFVWMFSECIGIGTSGYLATIFTTDAPANALAVMGVMIFVTIYFSTKLPEKVDQTKEIA